MRADLLAGIAAKDPVFRVPNKGCIDTAALLNGECADAAPRINRPRRDGAGGTGIDASRA